MDPFMRMLYTFYLFSFVGGTVYGMYYGVFLYKHTFSLSILALDGLFGAIGTWLGYLGGMAVVRRRGYNWCIRVAFVIWMTVSFVTALIANHIAEWFILISVLKAIPSGMYSANCDTIMLREVGTSSRNNFFQFLLGGEFLLSVLLPSMVGGLIGLHDGYLLAFVLAGVIYAAALTVPVRLARPLLARIRPHELAALVRRPHYVPHALNRMTAAGFNQLNALVIAIIPFLLLKNEFKMGFVSSAMALLAGIISLTMRHVKPKHQLRAGFGAHAVKAVVSAFFVTIWTTPAMLIWQLFGKLATPLHDPLQQGLDVENDSLILGKDLQTKAVHINILNNTLLLIGAMTAYGAFYLITRSTTGGQRGILQLLVMVYAAWRFVNLLVSARINDALKQTPQPVHVRLAERVPLAYALQLIFGSAWNRLRANVGV